MKMLCRYTAFVLCRLPTTDCRLLKSTLLLLTFFLLGISNPAFSATVTLANGATAGWTGPDWSNGTGPVAGDDIVIGRGATLTMDANSPGPGPLGTITFTTGAGTSTINLNGFTLDCGAITMPNNIISVINVGTGTLNATSITMANLTGETSTLSISTGTATITGNITMSGSSTENLITFSGAGLLQVGGNMTGSGTLTPSTGTVEFTSAGASNFAGYTFNNLLISGAGTKTINSNATVAGTLNISAGTLDPGTADLTVNGTTTVTGSYSDGSNTGVNTFTGLVTLNAAGTWNSTNETTAGGTGLIFKNGITNNNVAAGSFQAGAASFTTNIQALTGPGSLSFSADVVVGAGVTLTNNTTVTMSNTASATLSGTGTWMQGNGSTLNYAGSTNTVTTFDAYTLLETNTVNYNGSSAQTIRVTDYDDLTVTNSCGACTVTGTGTYSVNDFFIDDANTVTTDNITVNTTTIIDEATATLETGAGAATFNGTTTLTNGTLQINSNALGSETFENLVVEAGGIFNNSADETVTINGDITNNGGTFTSGTGLYTLTDAIGTLNGTALAISNVSIDVGASYTNNITAAAGFSVATSLAGAGSLTQAAGADLLLGGTTTITTLTATAAGNLVTYNGAGAQTVYSTTYDYLRINKSTNDATLGGGATIQTQLTMSSGDLILSGNNLILDPDATVSGGAANSYINADLGSVGRLIKQLDATTPLGVAQNFPLGDASGYTPLSLTFNSLDLSAGAQLSMGVDNVKDPDNTSDPDYIRRYWSIVPTGINDVDYDGSFTYLDADVNGTESNYVVGAKNSSNIYIEITTGSVDIATNTATFTNAKEFMGNLTLGMASAFPIEVCCFKATLLHQNDVLISWKTMSEKNSLRYIVERGIESDSSVTWYEFDSISTKADDGNSTDSISYDLTDYNLPAGVYYYRLWEVGKFGFRDLYKEIVSVEIVEYNAVVVFGQNGILLDKEYVYEIFDLLGRKVREGEGREIMLYGIKRGIYLVRYGKKVVKVAVFLSTD